MPAADEDLAIGFSVRGADDGIKPGVKRSGTPGTPTKKLSKPRPLERVGACKVLRVALI